MAIKYYFFGGQRVAMKSGSTLTYLHGDHLGSTALATTSAGAWQSQEKYFAYGKDRDNANNVPTDNRFTGQKSDGSGLMYYSSRYYDPQTGLFVSPDTIVADPGSVMSYNRTLYTLGNPIKYNDPSGHICVPVIQYGSTCGDPTLVDTAIELVVSVAAGDVNDVVTLVTGHDYVSGQEVAYFSGEWWLTAGATLLPVVSGSTVKGTGKALSKVDDVLGTGVGKKVDDAISWVGDCLINSFSAETLVMTARGLRPISELIEGDLVLAWDEATGKTGYFVVTDTISHVDPEIVLLTLDGETLETTAEHPFYVVETSEWLPLSWGGRWVDAGELQVGDDVLQADGSTGEVQSVRVVAQRQPMYNLTVDQAHTFFVGQGQWLVHNAGPCKYNYSSSVIEKMEKNVLDLHHNFPTQLDEVITSSKATIVRADGRQEFLMKGTLNDTSGVYHITLGSDGKTIIHRLFVEEKRWSNYSQTYELPGISDVK